ncbi:MAG: helix-hairpin-helix domain-containing protein [Nitrosomonadales bacterium]|nr:helix-hairpin-helix domain-containing protein [Nitrosomonadales bacterium]
MKKLLLALFMSFAFSGISYAAVDLNTATKAELEAVKGVGSAKADAILEYRKQHGAFKSVDELNAVPGFGDKSVEKMRGEFGVGKSAKK